MEHHGTNKSIFAQNFLQLSDCEKKHIDWLRSSVHQSWFPAQKTSWKVQDFLNFFCCTMGVQRKIHRRLSISALREHVDPKTQWQLATAAGERQFSEAVIILRKPVCVLKKMIRAVRLEITHKVGRFFSCSPPIEKPLGIL